MQTSLAPQLTESLVTAEDLAFLEEIVNIDSQSKNVDGVNLIQSIFAKKLNSLGMESSFTSNSVAVSGDLLVARSPGKSPIKLTTIGHADTVLSPNKDHQFAFTKDMSRILGPGIADNKAGIFIAMKGIEYFLKNCEDQHLTLEFVSSPNEEVGSPGFHKLFNEMGKESHFVLGFEPSMECGSIIHSRNGNCWYRIEVEGKTFHSGRAHKGHMNAAHDLCKKIDYFFNEVQKHDDITMNVGMMQGGHSFNTVCEKVMAKIDTRFSTFEGLNAIQSIFENCHNHLKYPCSKTQAISRTEIHIDDFCPPLEYSDKSKFYIKKYLEMIHSVEGEESFSVHCGGAADVNHFSHPGVIAFDGLGAIGGNMHRMDEYIVTESLNTRAKSFGEFLLLINESIKGIKS